MSPPRQLLWSLKRILSGDLDFQVVVRTMNDTQRVMSEWHTCTNHWGEEWTETANPIPLLKHLLYISVSVPPISSHQTEFMKSPLPPSPLCPRDHFSQSHIQDSFWCHLPFSSSPYLLLKCPPFHSQSQLALQINFAKSQLWSFNEFLRRVFTEHLLCAKNCSKYWEYFHSANIRLGMIYNSHRPPYISKLFGWHSRSSLE